MNRSSSPTARRSYGATPGVFAGDNPFGTDEPPNPDRVVPPLPGVVRIRPLNKNTPGHVPVTVVARSRRRAC
jgi:hypothetical protein